MKKFFLLTMASMMTVFAMAIGRNDGSTKANAIDFDWDQGNVHTAGTKWYHVDLTPLYQEENPSLTLYVTNPSRDESVEASMTATVAGETETKHYTVSPHEHQVYSANATMLVRLHQTEIYLTLTTDGEVRLSAKVFEASDLDETCKNARELKWDTETTQTKGYAAWWKVNLNSIKDTVNNKGKDARVTITNIGTGVVNLRTGQSLDCPSSGLTKRNYTLAAGESLVDTIPQSMILSVYPDEIYFSIENLEQPVKMKVDMVNQPVHPIIPGPTGPDAMTAVDLDVNPTDTTIQSYSIPAGTTLFAFSVADLNALAKYEPEFTYRNENGTAAHVTVKMAFERPAYGTTNSSYTIAAGEDEIVVYKKNMLEGMTDVDSIYLLTIADQPITFLARYKHVREGKACKTNIDFNWESGHTQEARTTQWYAIDVAEARDNIQDIVVHVQNMGTASATVTAQLAFSCPYYDLSEVTRTVAANGQPVSRVLGYSSYAMMSDTVWIGLTTSENIKFWATTQKAPTKEADEACLTAIKFNWDDGVMQNANDTVWYKIAMEEAREKSAKFPTVFVQNLSADAPAKIEAELSMECPDSIANEKRSLTIAANGSYSRTLARNMFENIKQDTIYLRVISSQAITLQIRLTEEAEGASCSSAIPFNWVSGNTQEANANLWYSVDLRNVMKRGNDFRIHLENKDNEACRGVIQLAYSCPVEDAPSVQDFKLAKKATKSVTIRNSTLETVEDSIVYINLQGTTALRFWADTLKVVPFDTIKADGLTLIPLQWDSLYTQNVDTAWYIIPKSEIDLVRNMEEKQKPVAHLINLGTAECTVQAEAAFAFPIVKKMMSKSQTLKSKQHFSDTIPAATFEQILKKDSIILRVVRKAGAPAFQFRAELVKANTGNTRYDAEPISFNKHIIQEPNTTMWYKVKTADWKKDKSLIGKSLHVSAQNIGTGDADITVAVYEGLLSNVEMIDYYTGKQGKRTVKKGEGKSHNIPAQAVFALGDVEMYIQVQTNQRLEFKTSLSDYASAPADPAQQKAKMLVPNVDYPIKANETQWFLVCAPYIRNNYKYVDASNLAYELEGNGPAKIEVTATVQDTLVYKVPVRTRTINKSGTARKGKRPLKDLLNKAIKKAGSTLDVSGFQEAFVDSILRRYATSDSITGYVRINTDKAMTVRLNTPQTTGDAMRNPMMFDWEHGNVNPENQKTWYRAEINSWRIPDTCDLRLHVTNWSDQSCVATAKIYLDTLTTPKTKSYTLAPNEDKWHDIGRTLLAGQSDLLIDYHSDYTTHIWAEIIPARERDSIVVDTTLLACDGDVLTDPYTGATWMVDVNDPTTMLRRDSISFLNDTALAEWDSICYIHVVQRVNPTIIEIADIPAVDQVIIQKGLPIDYVAADAWLRTQFADERTLAPYFDTIAIVNNVVWERSTNDANDQFEEIDPTVAISDEAQVIRYQVVTECGDSIPSNLFYNTVRDTIKIDTCKSYRWIVKNPAGVVVKDSTYTASTTPMDSVKLKTANFCDHWMFLKLTILEPVHGDTVPVSACKSITWRGKPYSTPGVHIDTIPGGAANGCDSIAAIDLTILPDETKAETITKCFYYEWKLSDGFDTICYTGGTYTHKIDGGLDCDTVVTLNLTINGTYSSSLTLVPKYGDRLLMIHRKEIQDKGWTLDDDDTDLVQWYKESTPSDIFLGYGFYYTKSNGAVLDPGTYYAVVEIPASAGAPCGTRGETNHHVVKGASGAPALMPSLARPGEDIRVVNLNPDEQTTIRIYTTEGLNKGSYTVRGEDSFTIKAGNEHGFYLVEIVGENEKSTLRYIVK